MPVIITIDGPSGVGKGTAAASVASYFGFHLLDSGALYRLAALNALRLGLNHSDAEMSARAVKEMVVEFTNGAVLLHGKDVTETIRSMEIGQLASKIAIHASVRDTLFAFMHDFVRLPGIVADGRDMGAIVFPGAHLKIFLTASAEVRAERRYKQLKANGKDVNLHDVFSELAERDRRDKTRSTAPLEPAKDAVVIDTGVLGVTQVFEQIVSLASQAGIVP